MAVGDVHRINDYEFVETLHGPNVERQCVDCGKRVYGTPDAVGVRCERHAKLHLGVPLGMRPKVRSRYLSEGPSLATWRARNEAPDD